MMMDQLKQARSEVRSWQVVACVAAALAGYAMWGWNEAPTDIRVHIPPDLRAGAVIHAGRDGTFGEVPPSNIYDFALRIWMQLNAWSKDGEVEYGQRIYSLQHFLTASCQSRLTADMDRRAKQGELRGRARAITEIPGMTYEPGRVEVDGTQAWRVYLDAQLRENINFTPVKDVYIQYPLRIVRYDINRDLNEYGLALDCFGNERPLRLDPQVVKLSLDKGGKKRLTVSKDAVQQDEQLFGAPATATSPASSVPATSPTRAPK